MASRHTHSKKKKNTNKNETSLPSKISVPHRAPTSGAFLIVSSPDTMVLFFDLPPSAKHSSAGGSAGWIQLVCGSICLEIAYLSLRSFYFLPRQLQQRSRRTWWLSALNESMLLLWILAFIFCLSMSLQQGPNYTGFIILLCKRPVVICCSCKPVVQRAERGVLAPAAGQTRPRLYIGAERVQIIKKKKKTTTNQARDNTATTDQSVRRRNGTVGRPEKAGRPFVGKNRYYQDLTH